MHFILIEYNCLLEIKLNNTSMKRYLKNCLTIVNINICMRKCISLSVDIPIWKTKQMPRHAYNAQRF